MRLTSTSLALVLILTSLIATLSFVVHSVPSTVQLLSPTRGIQDNGIEFTELNDSVPFNITSFGNETYKCEIVRAIKIHTLGGIVETTKISITNNGTAMFNSLNFTVPTSETKYLKHLSLKDLSNKTQPEFDLVSSDENDTNYMIRFADINQNETYSFQIIAGYTDSWQIKNRQLLYNKSFLPLLSIPITSIRIVIRFPTLDPNATLISPNIEPINATPAHDEIQYNFTHLPASNLNLSSLPDLFGYNQSTADMLFIPAYRKELHANMTYHLAFTWQPKEDQQAYIEYLNVKRTIKVKQWDRIITTEEITILNKGPANLKLKALQLYEIPIDAKLIGASDYLGNLSTIQLTLTDTLQITIQFRIALEMDKTYTFKISYQESIKTGLKESKGKFKIQPWLMSRFNVTVREYQMDVILPFGASYKGSENFSTSPEVSFGKEKGFLGLFYNPKITYTLYNQTPPDNTRNIAILYKLNQFTWFIYEPFTMMIAFLLIGITYIVIRLAMTTNWGLVAPIVEEIPYEEIERFVRAYEEKTSLQERMKRLTADYRRRKIKATKFEKSKTLLDHKITEAERELVQVAGTLRKKGRRYDTGVRNIEVAELEREDVLENIKRLEKRRTDGVIGKDAYARLKRDYNQQLQRANNRIDKALIELRASLTERR